jgi:hypothetical protein
MSTTDDTAQFREPPVGALPEMTTTSTSQSDISAQFREPPLPHSSIDSSASTDSADNDSMLHKPLGKKIKDVLKKPFSSSSSSDHSDKLGETEMKSPELEAAQEVLATKHLTSP